LRLRVAAADGNDDVRLPTFSRGRVAEVRGQPGVGLLTDRASVEDEDVGIFRSCGFSDPERFEHPLDPLRVVSVHLAAECRDVVPAHPGSVARTRLVLGRAIPAL
jgi:hypothetical protein